MSLIPHYKALKPIVLTRSDSSLRWLAAQQRCGLLGIEATPFVNTCHDPRPGYCATVGHLAIIKQLQQNKEPFGFIVEDDLCFCDRFAELYRKVVYELEEFDWDLFYFGGNILGSAGNQRLSEHIIKPQKVYCNHAYLIREEVYQQAIDALESSLHGDHFQVVDAVFAELPWNLLLAIPMLISQVSLVGTLEEILIIHNIMEQGYKNHAS